MTTSAAASTAPLRFHHLIGPLAIRFFRHGAALIGGALIITCGVPTILAGLNWFFTSNAAADLELDSTLHMILRLGEWVLLPAYLVFEVIHVRPLYRLPLTSSQILHAQLLSGVVAIAAIHLFTATYYTFVFGMVLPVWEPLLFLCPATIAIAGLAALVIDFRWWRPFFVSAFAIGTAIVIGDRTLQDVNAIDRISPIGRLPLEDAWLTPSPSESAAALLVAAIGYLIARHTLARDRCGELRPWPDLEFMLYRLSARLGG